MNTFMYGLVFTLILLLNIFCGVYMFYIDNPILGFLNSIVAVIMVVALFLKGFANGK